jgi:hypothetical protein
MAGQEKLLGYRFSWGQADKAATVSIFDTREWDVDKQALRLDSELVKRVRVDSPDQLQYWGTNSEAVMRSEEVVMRARSDERAEYFKFERGFVNVRVDKERIRRLSTGSLQLFAVHPLPQRPSRIPDVHAVPLNARLTWVILSDIMTLCQCCCLQAWQQQAL